MIGNVHLRLSVTNEGKFIYFAMVFAGKFEISRPARDIF